MPTLRATAVIAALGVLSACSHQQATATSGHDGPIPGALPSSTANDTVRATQSEAPIRNSDNRPIESRSGLNSDPSNPNGVPGHPSITTMD
jgi:hypothetical protein